MKIETHSLSQFFFEPLSLDKDDAAMVELVTPDDGLKSIRPKDVAGSTPVFAAQ